MAVESALLVTIGTSLASGLLKSLMQKSADALSESSSAAGLKSALSGNLESQLAHLKRELEKLDALLCCAERMTPAHHNRNALLLHWLGSIKEAANFADNLLDDISYERLRRQVESNTVSNLLLPRSVGSLGFRIKIGRKLNKCMSMIDEIYKEADKIGLRSVELVANPSSYQPPAANSMSADLREIRENADTSFVVGREADEKRIVDELCRPNNDRVLGVIAIVGMSGVGKTTLARKIYDNEIVTKQYKNKIWIFVSDDFNLRRFLDEMLQSLTGDNHNLPNTDAMEKKLRSCLEKERYLLVLDDVWNTNKQVWDSIRTSLVRVAGGCTGTSMLLVTTQIKEVASVMGASLTRVVKILSKDDSWKLFEGKAFANKSPKQVSDLRDVGERILKKCGGLPLAINTLASLLKPMNERSQWESVDRSQVWDLPESASIMPWLLLSFNHLSEVKCPAIKQCFAHCSILFSKGKDLTNRYLISCWIAQGFIQLPETSDQDWMAIGQLYIESMLAHGFLQIYSHNGFRQCFTMHDLIHDLAVYVSGDKYLTIRDPHDLLKASSGVEHVSIDSQLDFPKGSAMSTLRTLICRNATISMNLGSLKHLMRALTIEQLENISSREDVVGAGLKNKAGIVAMNLGWSIEVIEGDIIGTNDEEVMEGLQPHPNLKQLWVRNFRGKRLSLWLSSGLHCINLTKLTLLNCKRCEQLPTLGCLPCLKHLRIDGMESVEVIGRDFFVCSSTGCRHNDMSQCNLFPCLEEFLLWNMPILKEWIDPSGSCASAFPYLQKLMISNCPLLVSVPSCFHSLQDLTIEDINSSQPLLVILSNSYKLTSLRVVNVQQLTCLSEPLLKCTSLRLLIIKYCKDLVELPPTLQSMGCLEALVVKNCGSLTSLPDIEGLLSLRELEITECEQITDPPCGLESCVSIEGLFVNFCPNLNFNLDLAMSSRLRRVSFCSLSKQTSVMPWLNQLSNLTDMYIGGFNNELDNFCGIEHLPKSLKMLSLTGWPKLKSLPDELQTLTQLETLWLWRFDGVTALPEWLSNLSSLQSLLIGKCKNMKHLPSVDVIRRLTRLGELEIEGCPLLEERCRKEGGEEWHKISHIPRIRINDEDAADDGTKSPSRMKVVREALSGWVKRRVAS